MSTLTSLSAVGPIDGRYQDKTASLSKYFSELGLIRYRVRVEVEYYIALAQCDAVTGLKELDRDTVFPLMRGWSSSFTEEDAKRVKEIEKVTNHDLKAVEYWIKEKMAAAGLQKFSEFVHFALTSQDINNTCIPLSFKEGMHEVIIPTYERLAQDIKALAVQWMDVPMLAHTHGQPATPTRVGKEFYVFVERLERQITTLKAHPYEAKFGGATGGFNAHKVAFPTVDWIAFANTFVNETLGLFREQWTTQISHYDNIAAICDNLKRINTILLDFCKDVWQYISMNYFKQKIVANEVGSSAMPHKVNPIDFENAEGNFGVANALLEHLSTKLPISRLQRDLTDSTVLRNLGVPMGHILIALGSLRRGLGKLVLHKEQIEKDLEDNWVVVSEAIQTILRREAYPNPYEALKKLTRTGEKMNHELMKNFIDELEVSQQVKDELVVITPFNYIGVVPEF